MSGSRDLEDYQQRLDKLILYTRILFKIESEDKAYVYLATRPDCYDFETKCTVTVLETKQLEVPSVRRDPHIERFEKTNDFLKLLFYVDALEQEAVIKLLENSTLESKDKDFGLGRRIFLAHKAVTRQNVRDLVASGNLMEGNLRKVITLQYTVSPDQMGTALTEIERKYNDVTHFVGSRYLFIGFVSVDSNYLRKYLWKYGALNDNGGGMQQSVDHRRVIILYDLKAEQFVIRSASSNTDVFFDDFSDEVIENYLTYETTEYKEMEIKIPTDQAYLPQCTRVFNAENEFQTVKNGETYLFSLDTFMHRYGHRVPFGIVDDDIKESEKHFSIYPVSYSVMIYSIIRTWVNQYSQKLPGNMQILPHEAEPYFLCYHDPVVGALTNSFQRGYPGLMRKRRRLNVSAQPGDEA